LANDPIHQFEIYRLFPIEVGGLDFSFTNSSLFMVAGVAASSAFLLLATRGRGLVPTRLQSVAELSYEFVASTLRQSAGNEGMRFFPFVFTIFMFVLAANLIGLFPYFFTVTAHIVVTASLAMTVMTIVVVYGLMRNGVGFFRLFVPSGLPVVLLPFVTFIEVLSFLSRPISLSIRLFANMLAGHITLKVFAGFVVTLGSIGALGAVGAILPFAMNVALYALEFLVAFVQAYVFVILTSLYLNDAIHPHH
jgi:F-type H+-transporting ATPase subunit a